MCSLEERQDGLVVFTIGAFGYEEESFLRALEEVNVDTFCDLRQRRGVRGSRYSFVNSTRLQHNLAGRGIRYVYLKLLAPTQEVRKKQRESDHAAGTTKRGRKSLDPTFIAAYRSECLEKTTVDDILASIPADAKRVAMFCVEELPSACHRSLAAEWLASHTAASVGHLIP